MVFWLLTVCLFILATAFILVPVWHRGRVQAPPTAAGIRASANVALFEERQQEFRSELEAGNLDQEQFDALILELQQSLLADVSADEEPHPATSRAGKEKSQTAHAGKRWTTSQVVPAIIALLIPVFAYVLYNQWGYIDDVQLMDLFQRTVDNVDDPEEAQALIVSLGQVVQADEEQTWAWYFLAENFAAIGMFTEAEIAYQRAADLLEEAPEKALVLGRVAMAQYINAGFQFTPEILEVIEQARAINPNELSILNLLASDAAEREDYAAAIEYWRLLIQANPNSEQAQTLRVNIAAAQQLLREQDPDAAAGPSIDVNLRLADGLELAPQLRVFIAARNAAREGTPPLAAVDLTVAELPTTIRLDNSTGIGGPFNLSSADSVYVSALVSYAGVAMPTSGYYRVVSDSFSHNGENAVIDLVIAEQVP